MASLCAPFPCYLMSWWRRPRASLGPPLGRLIYRRRLILLFARSYASILVRFLFPCCFSFICSSPCVSPVRLVIPSRPCVSSRAIRCVVSSVGSSCRLVLACRLVWAPFRSAVRSFSFCLSGRFCLAFSCRLVLVSLLRLVRRLVGSSCFLPSSRFCLTRGRLGSVLVPGSSVRAVPSCSSLVPHSFHSSSFVRPGFRLRRGAGLCVMSMMAVGLVLVVLFIDSLRDGYGRGCGCEAPFHAARRSPLAYSCPHRPVFSHRLSHPVGSYPLSCVLIISSVKQENE